MDSHFYTKICNYWITHCLVITGDKQADRKWCIEVSVQPKKESN